MKARILNNLNPRITQSKHLDNFFVIITYFPLNPAISLARIARRLLKICRRIPEDCRKIVRGLPEDCPNIAGGYQRAEFRLHHQMHLNVISQDRKSETEQTAIIVILLLKQVS